MSKLKYYIIESKEQYFDYCSILEKLVFSEEDINSRAKEREIDLLTLLIETWDRKHHHIEPMAPISLLKSLMEDHQLKAKDLVPILDLSKSTVSRILICQIALTRKNIERLAQYFKVFPDAFNAYYELQKPNKREKSAA